MKYWLAWVTYSFHWDEVRHCDGQPQQGRNVWQGEEFPKNPKGRACESMLDMEKWKPTHLSQPSLSFLSSYNSQSPNPPSVGLNVHMLPGPIFIGHASFQNGSRQRHILPNTYLHTWDFLGFLSSLIIPIWVPFLLVLLSLSLLMKKSVFTCKCY